MCFNEMAPPPIASALQAVDEDEERSDSFPITWILAIIFNVLFIVCLFAALIYCIKRRKQSTCDHHDSGEIRQTQWIRIR